MDPRQDIKELLEIGRKADREDKERAAVFEGLVKHPGWELYVGLLNSRLQAMGEAILEPAGTVDGAVALEYVKGTMRGVILARDTPQLIIQAMKAATPASGDET